MSSPQPSPQDNRNFMIALLLCALIFLGFDYMRIKNAPETTVDTPVETLAESGAADVSALAPTSKADLCVCVHVALIAGGAASFLLWKNHRHQLLQKEVDLRLYC